MMKIKRLISVVLFACLLPAPACTGTKLINPWKDAAYQGQVKKMFVIGIVRDRGPRSLLEDEFVRSLKEQGTEGMASTSIFPGEAVPARAAVEPKVRELGFDAVLVVKFIKKETGDTYTPGRNYPAPQNMLMSWDEFYGVPDYTEQDRSYGYNVVTMQTTLFSVETIKPIWSSRSETRYEGGPINQIEPFVRAIVRALRKEQLIAK